MPKNSTPDRIATAVLCVDTMQCWTLFGKAPTALTTVGLCKGALQASSIADFSN